MAFQTLSPGTLLSPVPAVMVSCAMPGKRPNVITVAWAGTVCSDPPMLSISVRKERFSHHILLESGEFVVNLVGREQLQAADYCGVRSGRDVDKFADCGLTAVPAQGMDCAPAIAQCPLYLACKTQQVIEPPTVMAYTMHWAMRWASLAILWLRPRCASAACAS